MLPLGRTIPGTVLKKSWKKETKAINMEKKELVQTTQRREEEKEKEN